jgi:hypothetical protein
METLELDLNAIYSFNINWILALKSEVYTIINYVLTVILDSFNRHIG